MNNTFFDTMAKVGKRTETWQSPDGSRIVVLPYGARIIGLFASGDDNNFLWTNPELENIAEAKAMFEGTGWHNTGGDRTWLTPELDIFFPDYPDASRHVAPPQLDASDYKLSVKKDSILMSRQFAIKLARPGQEANVQLVKQIGPAANPLRYEKALSSLSSVQYAGYTLCSSLKLLDKSASAPVQIGLWNLLQLPHGGDMLIPTYCKSQPRVLFGDIAPENLVVDDNLIRFRIVTKGEHKIALRAVAVTGRAGYLWQSGEDWSLVIRNFHVDPSGEYVDIPKDNPNDLGYAFHAVSVDSALGAFCELEYHVPAIGAGTGRTYCEDESQVWAFRGPHEEILAIARCLLSQDAA